VLIFAKIVLFLLSSSSFSVSICVMCELFFFHCSFVPVKLGIKICILINKGIGRV